MPEPANITGSPTAPTIERITAIMRRDLKLPVDVQIDSTTPLIGGDLDLDSLDVLLLVTSLEKEFGIKVADGSIGREAFRDVATLAGFVERAQGARGHAS